MAEKIFYLAVPRSFVENTYDFIGHKEPHVPSDNAANKLPSDALDAFWTECSPTSAPLLIRTP
jgi:hypothetical protein